jgi:D-glycero-D-manno-heptose 1,7-bisphosphate phosphatase
VTGLRPAAFLDRDGTLIRTIVTDGKPVPDHGTVTLLDGAREACAALRQLGFVLVMVTNQPDVARGLIDRASVEASNVRLAELLELDLALSCMHDDLDRCHCRKPRPGMLTDAAQSLGLCLDQSSVMIGDRWRDIDAGSAAGVTTVLIDRGYGELLRTPPDHTASNITNAVEWIDANLTRVSS